MSNKVSGLRSNVVGSPLALALIATYEPLQKKFDEFYDPANGHEAPSVQNNYFRMLIGMHAQQDHRQLADSTMKRADGTPIDNISTQIAKAGQTLNEYIARTYNGDWELAGGDATVARQSAYIERLMEQENVERDMLDAFKAVYLHFFKEEWKPQQAAVTNVAEKAVVNKRLSGIQARLQESFDKAKTEPAEIVKKAGIASAV